MSDAEETLMLEIHKTKQNAQETWLHVRCSKMLDALGALKVEHAAALSRARAEALEGVAKTAERRSVMARRVYVNHPLEQQGVGAADALATLAADIRVDITTPAPATIPVERVRRVMKSRFCGDALLRALEEMGIPYEEEP